MDEHGLTDATVKMYLLPNQSSSNKRKTQVIKHNLSPVWNEQFTYENICLEDLSSGRVLEVTVWDYDRRGSNDFIGGLRIGPHPDPVRQKLKNWMDSIGDEVSHWEAMLERPGEWVEQWHVLRPSMEPLNKHRVPSSFDDGTTNDLEKKSTAPTVVEDFSFSTPPITKMSVPGDQTSDITSPERAEELLLFKGAEATSTPQKTTPIPKVIAVCPRIMS